MKTNALIASETTFGSQPCAITFKTLPVNKERDVDFCQHCRHLDPDGVLLFGTPECSKFKGHAEDLVKNCGGPY